MIAQKKNLKQSKKPTKKQRRVEPVLPGGFRDYGPAEAIARKQMIETIRKTFESFGFDPMETSSIQRTEVLTGGEENSGKIIFNVKGSQEKESDTSLRFDLTVPLARFIAANPDIPKPFKRYEIGRVWRGERPQAGRYREFMQADVDIAGQVSLRADAEIIAVIYQTLKNLGISNFLIKINNRKLLNYLCDYINDKGDLRFNLDLMRIVDKKDKDGEDAVIQEIRERFGGEIAEQAALYIVRPDPKEIQKVAENFSVEINKVIEYLNEKGIRDNYVIDYSLARGLAYYTGTIFETMLTDMPEIGSIFSGGRYDSLIMQFTGQPIPAVGASIGIDRLFMAMQKLGKGVSLKTNTRALILYLSDNLYAEYEEIANILRDASINCMVYNGYSGTLKQQLAYAVKMEIPFVIIYGDEEKRKGVVAVKNLETREQKEIKKDGLVEFFKK